MDGGNDYLIQVKGNQKFLFQSTKEHVSQSLPDCTYTTNENKRGRNENRQIDVYFLKIEEHKVFNQWNGLKTIIHIQRWGNRDSKKYSKDHYYISSIENKNAKYFAKGIRKHWSIENKLHWVKDVTLNEDSNRIRTGEIARNVSIIKSIMINVFRLNGYKSIKFALEKFSNKPKEAILLINE